MKLYTEEVIRKRLNSPYNVEVTIDEFIESLTPIELPSDEEIDSIAPSSGTALTNKAFKLGAKWMRDKIQGGNK